MDSRFRVRFRSPSWSQDSTSELGVGSKEVTGSSLGNSLWQKCKVLGWSMWFAGYISLERSWAKDEHTLKSGFRELNDFHQPFWLAVFVEGTRFTHAKLLLAQEYAVSAGIPIPRNVLIPRTKVHVRIERRLMKELPEDESGIAQ
ncbi:putative polyadenylate-binding protein RBP47B'-like isoform X1 [Capsicum annuum]|nr:putative polyadenylate-binding protein RBP47B'-like isoform X1 [Capsicum annuum]